MPLSDEQDLGQNSTNSSSRFYSAIVDESSFSGEVAESVFDKVESKVVTLEEGEGLKQHELEYLEKEKIVLVDFSELTAGELTKSLLNNIYSLAGILGAEELYASVSLLSEDKSKILRDLLVFGFEKAGGESFTSNTDVTMVRVDVNQEYDFVDLM
eukprot:TRINITY_DN7024_c0_g1_i5.p1 TRINITY_DN7024_c0_g1~~TRINITY_DN7024_c0_g1_i5.p1  ORF type:complete len:156 (-),score=48.26 TRINITY_DN7024_c0_g1_i5:337-804(-)